MLSLKNVPLRPTGSNRGSLRSSGVGLGNGADNNNKQNRSADDEEDEEEAQREREFQLQRAHTREEDLDLLIMHEHFSQGLMYYLRNFLSFALFVAQIFTDVLVAIQFYQDQHTNFSMSVVMIEVSMQLFAWRCTINPIVSFYQAKDRFKEFVFHSRDLKGNKVLDDEKDDKIWYCTTSRDVRLKLRMDTTLLRIQGFIFAGRTAGLMMTLLVILYCLNYGNGLHTLRSYSDGIYYISLTVSLCNFLYHLYLSVDLQYFIEMGGMYHFIWSDFFKYSMILGIFIVSDKARIRNGDAGLLALYFILMVISEACVYRMMDGFGSPQSMFKLGMFLAVWGVCMLILVIQWGTAKEFQDAALVLYALCGLPCLSLWSRFFIGFTTPALNRLKGGGSEKEWFFYGWMLSSETGKSIPTSYQTYDDFRHKILAFNTLIVDMTVSEITLMNRLHTRAYDKVYHLTSLQEFTEAQSFWKSRPLYLKAIHAWWYKKQISEDARKDLTFYTAMFIACAILRLVAVIAPLTTYWFIQEWHPFLHACSICYIISLLVAGLLYIRYLYFAAVVWAMLDAQELKLRLGPLCRILTTIKEQEFLDASDPSQDNLYQESTWPAPQKIESTTHNVYGNPEEEDPNVKKVDYFKDPTEKERRELMQREKEEDDDMDEIDDEDDEDDGAELDLQITDDVDKSPPQIEQPVSNNENVKLTELAKQIELAKRTP